MWYFSEKRHIMTKDYYPLVGIGQQMQRFTAIEGTTPCVIAGIVFDDIPGFQASSDGDVVFQALCNAISSLTGIQILNDIAKELRLSKGITDSEVYLQRAKELLNGKGTIAHVSISIEAKKPRFQERIEEMRKNTARVLNLSIDQVGITAISGAGLTDVGCGEGVSCTALLSIVPEKK